MQRGGGTARCCDLVGRCARRGSRLGVLLVFGEWKPGCGARRRPPARDRREGPERPLAGVGERVAGAHRGRSRDAEVDRLPGRWPTSPAAYTRITRAWCTCAADCRTRGRCCCTNSATCTTSPSSTTPIAPSSGRIFHIPASRPWWSGKTPLAEWFAEGYSWCARYTRIVSVKRYAIYDYNPTPGQHSKLCSLIRRAAHDSTPPQAPPAPAGDRRRPRADVLAGRDAGHRARRSGARQRPVGDRAHRHGADRHRHADARADGRAHADPRTHTDPNGDAPAHPHPAPDADGHRQQLEDADADTDPHGHRHAHADGDADRDRDRHARPVAHA